MSEEELDPSITTKVKELRAIVDDASKSVQQQSDEILSALVSNAVGFGYPNGEELQLGVKTQLSIDEQIKNQTQLSYTAGTNKESLPSQYNGLGYKNLIKMEFLLAAFAKKVEENGNVIVLKNNKPQYVVSKFEDDNFDKEMQMLTIIAKMILTEHSNAFEELAR